MLAPTTTGRLVQIIDVTDLADWIEAAGRAGHTGRINAVGEVHSMASFFDTVRSVTGHHGELREVDDDVLLAHGLRYWAGPRSLPLWLPRQDTGFAQRNGGSRGPGLVNTERSAGS